MINLTFFRKIKSLILLLTLFVLLFQCSEEELTVTPEPASSPEEATARIASIVDCSSCTYVVPPNKPTVDGKVIGIKPGDVICLNAATTYGNIAFKNIVGSSYNPVIVTNCGGPVTINAPGKAYVVKFENSKHLRFSGGNIKNAYGIRLTGATVGLVMGYLSTNFVVDHIEAFKVGFAGIMAKTEPSCDDATIRGNFTMRQVTFRYNYVHDTGGEGFYIGHTSWGGKETSCGLRLPHTIENVNIHDNIVRNSGWDAIQLASAPKGAAIYHNTIENYSTANQQNQTGGICLSSGTGGLCYSNYIKGGNGGGIVVFGIGDNSIYNNVIVNAGKMGIFCDERMTFGKGYRFMNNTIINPKTEGLLIYADLVPMNLFINNIVVNPGSYAAIGQRAYVRTLSANVKMDMSNNIFTQNINDLKFLNAAAFNYKLTAGSPAIDKGRDISIYNIPKDFYRATRLKGTKYDIGATEYQGI